MNISDEKVHIYSLMRDVTEERRKLTDIYYDLKLRLDELNTLETRGLEDLSVKGYADLYNNREKTVSVANVEREMKKIVKNIEDDSSQKKKDIIPREEIDRQKEKEKISQKSTRPSSYMNFDKVVGVISHILKESGVPVSLRDLHEKVQEEMDVEIKINNFRNNIIHRALQRNKNIQRAMRGYYQYKS